MDDCVSKIQWNFDRSWYCHHLGLTWDMNLGSISARPCTLVLLLALFLSWACRPRSLGPPLTSLRDILPLLWPPLTSLRDILPLALKQQVGYQQYKVNRKVFTILHFTTSIRWIITRVGVIKISGNDKVWIFLKTYQETVRIEDINIMSSYSSVDREWSSSY